MSRPRTDKQQITAAFAIQDLDGDTLAAPDLAVLEEPQAEFLGEAGHDMWAVIFAGGIGSRFWPLSTPMRPKQVLALVNERPLIADSVARLSPLIPPDRVLVVTSADIADVIHDAVPHLPRANLLVEPRPLGTAAALAWGAHEVVRRAGPHTVFVAMHADLAVGYPDAFRESLRRAAATATAGADAGAGTAAEAAGGLDDVSGAISGRGSWLVALGAAPTRAETGFGYLLPAASGDKQLLRSSSAARRVEHFVEKPGPALADVLIGQGALWNTGIFVWQGKTVLDELTRCTHELAHALPYLEAGELADFAGMVTSVSIERGLLERTERLAVIPASFEWDDVGTWASLRRVRELDDTGNGVMGEVHCIDSSGNIIHADGNCVVAYGISGMVVVSIQGLTFVTTEERASELAPLLNALPGSLRFNPGGLWKAKPD